MGSPSRYIPALDGLRALAVIAVVIYHMNASFLPGGLLGVTIFFVLSGYLITNLLIREWGETKSINLPKFWIRRIRRLFPAIALVVMCTIVLTAVLAPDMLTKLRNDLLPALLWFTNWWYIFQDVSYFEAMGAPSPVTHFWSLAIEEQFYLIWPPILLLLFRKRIRKKNIQRGILVACAASAVLMAVLYNPEGDPSRVYYGTDTRAFSLLIGAWLAFEFPSARLCGKGRRALPAQALRAINYLGLAALAGILVMMALVSGFSPFMYYGGILLLSLLAGILVISLVNPANWAARFFALKPLVVVGKLSYSIYLWHYPLLLLMNPRNFTGETPWYMYLVQAAVIFVAAALSHKFVETPIRHGVLGRTFKQLRAHEVAPVDVLKKYPAYLTCTAALVIASVTCRIVVPPTETQAGRPYDPALSQVDPNKAQIAGNTGEQNGDSSEGSGEAGGDAEAVPAVPALADTPGDTPAEKAANTDFLLIGDSVTVALSDAGYGYFDDAFPNATIDSAIGRQLYAAKDIYAEHVAAGWNGPVVVFEFGANSAATSDQVNEMVDAVPAERRVLLVNARSPQPYLDDNNAILAQVAAERDNVELVDWYSYSAGHDEYFDGDGTHLTGTDGCNAYIALLRSALEGLYQE